MEISLHVHSRQRKKGKRGRGKRNIILFAVTVAGLAALIVMALLRRPVLIMPPEPPEITEKRQSPDNAFYTLQEAVALLPKQRLDVLLVPDKEHPEFNVPYEPKPHSIGALLYIGRPDNDPELLEFLKRCVPAIAKAREAMSKPYYLYSEIGTQETERVHVFQCTYLGNTLIAHGLRTWQTNGLDENVLSYLVDAIRLGRMIASDGGTSHFSYGTSVQGEALHTLSAHISEHDDEDMLRRVQGEIRELASVPQPLEPHLEFQWRMMDKTARRPPSLDPEYYDRRPFVLRIVENAFRGWSAKQVRRYISENRDLLFEGCTLSYKDFQTWRDVQYDTDEHGVYEALNPIKSLVFSRDGYATACNGIQLVLALELYRRDRGKYPETLDGLVPTYFDTLPADPFSGEPFIYRLDENEYWLYSISHNLRDDNGNENRDVLIHRPKVKPEPLPQPQPQPTGAKSVQPQQPASSRAAVSRSGRPGRFPRRPRPGMGPSRMRGRPRPESSGSEKPPNDGPNDAIS